METIETTYSRITRSALELFMAQGVKGTSLEGVAHSVGVSRVTIYRYFADKRALVEAALMRVPAMIDGVKEQLIRGGMIDAGQGLDALAAGFASLPSGDVPRLLEEVARVYPDVGQAFHARRLAAIQGVFDLLFARLTAQGALRPGLNRAVIEAYFLTAVVNVLEDPGLVHRGLPAAEIFATVKSIFLFGILKEG
jgi:AcrR family transcriptional regulator